MANRTHVPCNGCRACCFGQAVLLYPDFGDVIASYDAVPTLNPLTGEPAWELRHNDDHSCVYLGPEGCTIYERAPSVCRSFDCRVAYLEAGDTRAERRRLLRSGDPVLAAGAKRVNTITQADLDARQKELDHAGVRREDSRRLLRLWQATRHDVG